MALQFGEYCQSMGKRIWVPTCKSATPMLCICSLLFRISSASLDQHSACLRTFNARRYVYSLKGPPSAEALTAVRAILQAVILLVSMFIFGGRKERKVHPRPDEVQDDDAMVRLHSATMDLGIYFHLSRLQILYHMEQQYRWMHLTSVCLLWMAEGEECLWLEPAIWSSQSLVERQHQ